MARQGLKWNELIRRVGLAGTEAGGANPMITSIVEDSRRVTAGACFVAGQGLQVDGHAFVNKALEAGAVAVISEKPVCVPASVAAVRVPSARGIAGRLAATLLGLDQAQSDGRLKVVGITGTNGKSTFCYLVRSILETAGYRTAMLGTIQYDLVSRTIPASMTTPPAATMMGYLAEAMDAGATHAVMEVSSHALDQGRCDGVRFSVGVFSNLTGDHLDYHGDMRSYLCAKKKLFDGLDCDAVAVINGDDSASSAMVADSPARVIRYGVSSSSEAAIHGRATAQSECTDIAARVRDSSATGTLFDLILRGGLPGSKVVAPEVHEVVSSLVGRHNVQNCLAAAGAAIALGIEPRTVIEGLARIRMIPGRLQRVDVAGGDPSVTVLVDYAHTDDALQNVLSSLKPLSERAGGRLIVLFGCGGNRDRSKRPRMAAVAAKLADRIVVTSDNPRTEEPVAIIEEILAGFTPEQRGHVIVEPDRRKAIGEAIALACPNDIVLLAGKGHENYQEIGRERIMFDDVDIARQILQERMSQVS